MGNCSCSNPKQDDKSDREKWLLWEEPSFLMLFCGKCEYCCTCEQGKFNDDYPPFLAARGIDEQAFKADVAAITEHVREVTKVLHRMKDLRVVCLIVMAIAAVAGSLTAKLKGSTGAEFARCPAGMLAAAASRARSTANAGPATGAFGPATPAAPIDEAPINEGPRAAWGDPAPAEAAAAPSEQAPAAEAFSGAPSGQAPAAEVKAPSGLSFKMAARAAALRARARAQLREQAREEGDSEGGDPVAAALRFVGGDDVEEAIEAYKARSELLDAADELLDPANAQVHLHDAWEQRCVDAQV